MVNCWTPARKTHFFCGALCVVVDTHTHCAHFHVGVFRSWSCRMLSGHFALGERPESGQGAAEGFAQPCGTP